PRGLAADLRDANKSPAGIRSHSLAAARYSGHRRPPANFRHWRAVERRPILRPFTCKRPPRRGDRMTSNRTLLALTLGLLLASPLALVAGADGGIALPSAPTADQSTTSRLVYGLLSDSRYAYRPRALDDALSKEVFKRYLEALDPGKLFLTAQDVAGFGKYETRLDDAIKAGQVDPAWAIFAAYRQRVGERIRFARDLLKRDFDFTADESYAYDREDAPWAGQ